MRRRRIALIVAALYAAAALALADNPTAISKPGIEDLVDSDGRIQLEQVRAAEYEGPIDTEGHRLALDGDRSPSVVRTAVNSPHRSHPDDIYWEAGFETRQIACDEVAGSQPVTALAVFGGNLIVAGRFNVIGNHDYSNIAAWDGSNWLPLGDGVDGSVSELGVYDGKLYVGGTFSSAGGIPMHGLAVWDGTSWSDVGGSLPDEYDAVYRMIEFEGELVVAGSFDSIAAIEVNHVASWDGSSWSALGSGLGSFSGGDLVVYDGNLLACGGVGMSYHGVVEWDGASWQPHTFGQFNYPRAMEVFQGNLIAGGNFDEAGGVPVTNIASYDGVEWAPLGDGIRNVVYELEVFNDQLFALGYIFEAGGDTAQHIAVWDGASWSAFEMDVLGHHVDEAVEWNGNLVFSGDFSFIGGVGANYVGLWNNSRGWHTMDAGTGFGAPAYVSQLEVYNGKLIASGAFGTIGGTSARRIAAFNGTGWEPLGSGLFSSMASDMLEWNDKLIVAGGFTLMGDMQVNRIASWDGTDWDSLGAGLAHAVTSLAEYGGDLIAAGSFYIGDPSLRRIARWDGSSWNPLGEGSQSGMSSTVTCLAVFNGLLIAGGVFTMAGGVSVNRVAAWNGSEWSALGTGVNDQVEGMVVYDDLLLVYGLFTDAGGVPVEGMAAWNGSSWSAFESPLPSVGFGLYDVIVYDGKLAACGSPSAFPEGYNALAWWDGSEWTNMGSGISATTQYNSLVASKLCVYQNKLWVGGNFPIVGDKYSSSIAVWFKHHYLCGDADASEAVDIDDVVYLISYIFSGGPEPSPYGSGDADCSGGVDIDDAVYLIAYIFSGGSGPCDTDGDGVPDC